MNRALKIFFWVIALQIVSMLIGLYMKDALSGWYVGLNKSPFNPPQYVFPITWTFLYITIALAGFLLFEKKSIYVIPFEKIFFSIQLILNWSWTPIFFGMQNIILSLYCMTGIVIFTALTIIFSYKNNKIASFLLTPYFLWLLFASYLNLYIYMHN